MESGLMAFLECTHTYIVYYAIQMFHTNNTVPAIIQASRFHHVLKASIAELHSPKPLRA